MSGIMHSLMVQDNSMVVAVYNITVAVNEPNINIKSLILAQGWNGVVAVNVLVTIGDGIAAFSNSTSAWALDTDTGYPAGSTITLVNRGFIAGKGGAGAIGGYVLPVGNNGGNGGPALLVRTPVTIYNYGIIGGGGGGGGGSPGGIYSNTGQAFLGGHGGGGMGFGTATSPAEFGTLTSAGRPSSGDKGSFGYGGYGGSYGAAGQKAPDFIDAGGFLTRIGGNGGAPGQAVSGNSLITWMATGTVLGAIT